jgi:hypothetical protein
MRAPMSRVLWRVFNDHQPRAHLVAAVVRADPTGADPDPRVVQMVLERLVRVQKPASYYATTVVREAGTSEVHLAFEDKGDARKLAATVEAETTSNHPGWATERTFHLDGGMVAALAASLPPPRLRPKNPPSDGSPLRGRVRRGSRAPIKRDD